MSDMPVRINNRLKNYDYSLNGAYFITICIKKREKILWNTVGANCVRPNLSKFGMIIEQEIIKIPSIYKSVRIDRYAVMPNHIHILLFIDPRENGRTQFAPTVSRIVKQFKGSITKQIGSSVWQKSFHDRIVRNERDYLEIWNYIDSNPLNWEDDRFYEEGRKGDTESPNQTTEGV